MGFSFDMIVNVNVLAFRIQPNKDLKNELEHFIYENNISSGFVVTCVGSLRTVNIRMAGAKPEAQDIRKLEGHFEIVSLVGTLSRAGSHLHISVSDSEGRVTGGHLKEGSIVATTAEVVVGYDPDVLFEREFDESTGFEELVVK